MRKRLESMLLAIVMALSLVSVFGGNARAATVAASGSCGKNLTWTQDREGTLTVSGTGEMDNSLGCAPCCASWSGEKAS